MFDPWQQPLDIPALVRQHAVLKGELRLCELPRLEGLVLADAPVRFILEFSKDTAGQAVVTGCVDTVAELVCQRCLRPVSLDLKSSVALGVVNSEAEAKQLADTLEPLLMGDEPIFLRDMIEDEILLALPVVPRHAYPCAPVHREHSEVEKPNNPFGILRGLVKPSMH